MKGLTDKQQRFAAEYLVDFNATQAASRAGYSKKTAYSLGQRLLKHVEIQRAITAGRAKLIERTEISQDYVIRGLVRNAERAAQAEPVLDAEGCPTGEYTYQGSVVNGALKLLGQHLAMFTETVKVEGKLSIEGFRAAAGIGGEPKARP